MSTPSESDAKGKARAAIKRASASLLSLEPIAAVAPEPPGDASKAPSADGLDSRIAKIKAVSDTLSTNMASYDADFHSKISRIPDYVKLLEDAQSAKDAAKVEKRLAFLEKYVKSVEDENEQQRLDFQTVWSGATAKIDKISKALEDRKYGTPPAVPFIGALRLFATTHSDVDSQAQKGHWQSAMKEFVKLQGAMAEIARSVREFVELAETKLGGYQTVSRASGEGKYPGGDAEKQGFQQAVTAVAAALARAKDREEYGAAYEALGTCDTALSALQKSALATVLRPGVDLGGRATRKQISELLDRDPALLGSARPDQLDALVKGVGSKASSAADKKLVQAAITAKYGPELIGKLGGRYLCRLYGCLGKVPVAHTKENPSLKLINRTRKLFHDGDYADGTINLNVRTKKVYDKAGSAVGAVLFGNQFGFDVLTLHEVGHAVDDKKGFMATKGQDPEFGGWREHKIEEVADKVGEAKEFYKAYPKLERGFLQAYLVAVLNKSDPAKVLAAHAGAPAAKDPLWKRLGNHQAIKTCEAIRLKGSDSGLFDSSDPSDYRIYGRVYQESYEGKWTSYIFEARKKKVSNYQFRAAGEWYAEAYATFFLGKLPNSHPLYRLLQAEAAPG